MPGADELAQVRRHAVQRFSREPAVFLALDVEHRADQQRRLLAELDRARIELLAGRALEH